MSSVPTKQQCVANAQRCTEKADGIESRLAALLGTSTDGGPFAGEVKRIRAAIEKLRECAATWSRKGGVA